MSAMGSFPAGQRKEQGFDKLSTNGFDLIGFGFRKRTSALHLQGEDTETRQLAG